MKKALEILNKGGLVAFPTETVYGLGADATNDEACKKIYEIKSRPSNNPMIIHVSSLEKAKEIAEFNPLAEKLARIVWPGPISIVLKKLPDSKICETATAGLDTVAIRVPMNDLALDLLKNFGKPVAAPSANISNYISPTSAEHVEEAFGKKVYILKNEHVVLGLESTIIDMTNPDQPEILRAGFVTKSIISDILKKDVVYHESDKVIAPGMMKKHYSPHTNVRMDATELRVNEVGLGFGDIDLGYLNLSRRGDLTEAALNLYSMLRILDKEAQSQNIKTIAVAPIPNDGVGIAINDKLKRASG